MHHRVLWTDWHRPLSDVGPTPGRARNSFSKVLVIFPPPEEVFPVFRVVEECVVAQDGESAHGRGRERCGQPRTPATTTDGERRMYGRKFLKREEDPGRRVRPMLGAVRCVPTPGDI
uniref:Uncharacterized protein n=1 Tax=Odontella aurita TaxID=265563 RepID=A0A7S4N8W1_9STRA|mmetsp:Transcript_52792/g.158032  ORF Transcript_52792/g.158032 Transcript_52792/m.158032 type:complete len:117 (+) Transcript_52792:186-536(+)